MSEEGGKRFVNDWMLTLLLRSLASCPFYNHAVVTRLHGNKTHPAWNCFFFFSSTLNVFLFTLLVHKDSKVNVFKTVKIKIECICSGK